MDQMEDRGAANRVDDDVDTHLSAEARASLHEAYGILARGDPAGDPVLLHEAITAFRWVVVRVFPGHPGSQLFMGKLGECLQSRYAFTGNPVDLEGAILHLSQAIVLATFPNSHRFESKLAECFASRYALKGDAADLERAIFTFGQAIECSPRGDPSVAGIQMRLGECLHGRYARNGAVVDVNNGIRAFGVAVRLSPPNSPDMPLFLDRLGTAIGRYARLAQQGVLAEAVMVLHDALKLMPSGSPDPTAHMDSVVKDLIERWVRCRDMVRLAEEIAQWQQVEKRAPQGTSAPRDDERRLPPP